MKVRTIFLLLFAVILAYLGFYPVPIDPLAWTPPPGPALEGPYEKNDKLKQLDILFKGQCPQCEDVAIDSLGRIYGAASNGNIIRFAGQNSEPEIFARTGGRPLGLHFDSTGNLIVADAQKGLLSVDESGKIEVLTTEYKGKHYHFTDDLEIAADGMIYFSDASEKFGIGDFTLDLLEHRPHGSLLSFDPETGKTSLLLDSLYFANGIAVSQDGSFVLVNETGAYRIRRYWLKGDKKGQSDIFIDNLPGFPDGISRGSDGAFWLALISPRKPSLDKIMPKPFLRKLLVRLPDALQPKAENYGFVLGLNEEGMVVYNLQDPDAKFAQITSVQEFDGKLYLGSLSEDGIGVIDRPGTQE